MSTTLFYLFQCSKSQSTNEKHINGKDTKKGDLEKKIDLDYADIFDEVNNNSDNEDLHILKRLSKTHSMGDGKVCKATNNATVFLTKIITLSRHSFEQWVWQVFVFTYIYKEVCFVR